MTEFAVKALFQNMLGGSSAQELAFLTDAVARRLITSGLAVDASGVITFGVGALSPSSLKSVGTGALGDLLYYSGTDTLARVTGAVSSVLVTDGSKGPSLSQTLPSAVQGNITQTGTVTSGTWGATLGAVSGASLTSLTAGNLTGTIASSVQANITQTGTVGTGTWSALFGAVSGANLTNLTAGNLTGSHTLPDGVLSTNVPLLNAANVFTANQRINGVVLVNTGISTSGVAGDVIHPNNSAIRWVNSGGTDTVSALRMDANNILHSESCYLTILGQANASLPAAGSTYNGLVIQDTTNARLCFYMNGSRYYVAGTSF